MAKIVVYESNDEILITTKKREDELLALYSDRDFETKYDRYETDENAPFVRIRSCSFVSIE